VIARQQRLQRGQTLPAVMVIMLLLSLIAGGLAIAVSGALSQQALSKRRATADLSVQNGIEVAAARVQNGECSVTQGSSLKAASAPRVQSTHLRGVYPTGAPSVRGAYCLRMDGVDTSQLKRQTASPQVQTGQQPASFANGTCLSSPVSSQPATTVVIWFQVNHAVGARELAFGLRGEDTTCSAGLNSSQVGNAPPSPTSPVQGARRDSCSGPTMQGQGFGDPALTQVGFTCSLSAEPGRRELSIWLGQSQSSITVWMAPAKPRGGSVTMVAAPTGVSPGYEASLLASTGSRPELLYEEPLR
jgi:Tfp pilus assembly protein PilX